MEDNNEAADSIASEITRILVKAFTEREGRSPTAAEVDQLIEELTEERIEKMLNGEDDALDAQEGAKNEIDDVDQSEDEEEDGEDDKPDDEAVENATADQPPAIAESECKASKRNAADDVHVVEENASPSALNKRPRTDDGAIATAVGDE